MMSNYHQVKSSSLDHVTKTNPKNKSAEISIVTGPGIWYILHLAAYEANTPDKIKDFISLLRLIVERHPCHVCREHGSKYLKINPPENYVNTVKDERLAGMFVYVWIFHNSVNDRLGKPHVDYNTAWKMFSSIDQAICQADCGEDLNNRKSIPGDVSLVTKSPFRSVRNDRF
jgi:hypothetical protein